MQTENLWVVLMIDATITIGNMIEIAVLAAGGIAALVTVNNSVKNINRELEVIRLEFNDIKDQLRKVGEVLVRMEATDRRVSNVEQDIRELRHGQGFIHSTINKEYP